MNHCESIEVCGFSAEDIQQEFKVSTKEANAFLDRHCKHIEDRMMELGWEVITDIGMVDGLERKGREKND